MHADHMATYPRNCNLNLQLRHASLMWPDLSSVQDVTAFSISSRLEEARALILNATTPYVEKRSGNARLTTCMHTNVASYSPWRCSYS